jgi:hypothetical protein
MLKLKQGYKMNILVLSQTSLRNSRRTFRYIMRSKKEIILGISGLEYSPLSNPVHQPTNNFQVDIELKSFAVPVSVEIAKDY